MKNFYKIKKLVAIVLLLTFVVSVNLVTAMAESNVYYVSEKTGADSNVGSVDAPFASINKAISIMSAGDTCYVMGGTYYETVSFEKSGEAGKPITLSAYYNEEVIISSAEYVKDWEFEGAKDDQNIYKAYIGKSLDENGIVLFDNKAMDYAKWPNNTGDNNPIRGTTHDATDSGLTDTWLMPTWSFMDSATGKPEGVSDSQKYYGTIYDGDLPFSEGEINGAKITTTSGEGWYMYRGTVTESYQESFYINGEMQFGNYYIPKAGNCYYLYGHKAFLDYQNEWYCDDEGYIYIIAPNSKEPENFNVSVKTKQNGIELNSNDYINISGIKLLCGSIEMSDSDYINLNNIELSYTTDGINITGDNCTLSESIVRYSKNALVTVGGTNNKIINNRLEYGCSLGTSYAVNLTDALNAVITYNTVKYSASTGIGLVNKGGTLITHNDVSYYSIMCIDNGGIYGGTFDGVGTEVSYNTVHDGMSTLNAGIYTDNGVFDVIIHHNVVYNSQKGYQTNAPRTGNLVYNNTFADNSGNNGTEAFISENNFFINNLYTDTSSLNMYDVWIADGTYVEGGFTYDSIMKEYNNEKRPRNEIYEMKADGFYPKEGDSVIDSGVIISGITDDFTGSAPDIGAYEYGAEKWTSGCDFSNKELKNTNFSLSENVEYRNLVENGGFEFSGDVDDNSEWLKQGLRAAKVVERSAATYSDNVAVHTGKSGLRLGSASASMSDVISQTISGLKPNTKYLLSASGRIDAVDGANPVSVSIDGGEFINNTAYPNGRRLTLDIDGTGFKDFILVDTKTGRNGLKAYGLLCVDSVNSGYIGVLDNNNYNADGAEFFDYGLSSSSDSSNSVSFDSRDLDKYNVEMANYMLSTDWELYKPETGSKHIMRSKLGLPTYNQLSECLEDTTLSGNIPILNRLYYNDNFYIRYATVNDGTLISKNSTNWNISVNPYYMTYVDGEMFKNIPLDISTMGDYVKYTLQNDFKREELSVYNDSELDEIYQVFDVSDENLTVFDTYKWSTKKLYFVTDETGSLTVRFVKPANGYGYIDDVSIIAVSDNKKLQISEADTMSEYNADITTKYTFNYDGKSFTVLDRCEKESFIMCNDIYGNYSYDTNLQQCFNIRDEANIGYYLNNALSLPDAIKNNISVEHIWETEAGSEDGNAPLDYSFKAGITLLSYSEFLDYSERIDRASNNNSGVLGWWLRTGDDKNKMKYITSCSSDIVSSVNGDSELGIRPVFYLKDSFFSAQKLEIGDMGEEIKELLKNEFSYAELIGAGYTASDLAQMNIYNNQLDTSPDYVKVDGTDLELLYNDIVTVGDKKLIGFTIPKDYAGLQTKAGVTVENVEGTNYVDLILVNSSGSKLSVLQEEIISGLPTSIVNVLENYSYGLANNGYYSGKTYSAKISMVSMANVNKHLNYLKPLTADNTVAKYILARDRDTFAYKFKYYNVETDAWEERQKIDENNANNSRQELGTVIPVFYMDIDALKTIKLDTVTMGAEMKNVFRDNFYQRELNSIYTEEELTAIGVPLMPENPTPNWSSDYVKIDNSNLELLYNDIVTVGDKKLIGFTIPKDYAGVQTKAGAKIVDETETNSVDLKLLNTSNAELNLLQEEVISDLPASIISALENYSYGLANNGYYDGKTYSAKISMVSMANVNKHLNYLKPLTADNTVAKYILARDRDSVAYRFKYYDVDTTAWSEGSTNSKQEFGTVIPVFYMDIDALKTVKMEVATMSDNVKALLTENIAYNEYAGLYTVSELEAIGYEIPEVVMLDATKTIASGNTTVNVVINNETSNSIATGKCVIAAAYDGSRLVQVDYVSTSSEITAKTVSEEIPVVLTGVGTDITVKVMLWDGIDSLQNLSDSVTATLVQ